ncbi:LuxE/PaaK family acyltransferase [Clostridium hydrogenum]|uniref:LuxE/PaaK family acyltransferase n=1 Tax=Clostridium hydrogenum TaxID=2855764 RepID=UPI001F1A3C43|nr:acyl-protein synthetase [Clostridium hydrogenum]
MENLNFFDDFRRNLIDQYEKCEAYKIICDNQKYNPKTQLKCEEDIEKVPFLVTTVFKKSANLFDKLLKVPTNELDKWTVSSSTSGDPSFVGRKNEDIDTLRQIIKNDTMIDPKCEFNCVFYPEPEVMKKYKSIKIMDKPTESYIGNVLDLMADTSDFGSNAKFLLKPYEDRFDVDIDEFAEFIKVHDKMKHYLLIGGSTILLYNAVEALKKNGVKPVELGDKAIIRTGGGGWDGKKGNVSMGKKMERWQFVKIVSEFLGIPEENFIDIYSFTENSLPITGHYSSKLKNYLFHVPSGGRVVIRDPKTLKPLHNDGDKGLIQILNAYGTSAFAGASILVDDMAEIVSKEKCPECMANCMTIKILGRVKGSEAKGCGATLNVGGDKNEN